MGRYTQCVHGRLNSYLSGGMLNIHCGRSVMLSHCAIFVRSRRRVSAFSLQRTMRNECAVVYKQYARHANLDLCKRPLRRSTSTFSRISRGVFRIDGSGPGLQKSGQYLTETRGWSNPNLITPSGMLLFTLVSHGH